MRKPQTEGARPKPTTPQSSSRKPQPGTPSSTTSSHQHEDSEMPEAPTPGPSQATGDLQLRHPAPIHRPRGQVRLVRSRYPSMSTRAPHRRNPSRNRNSTRGGSWLLIVPYTLCSIRKSEAISRFLTWASKQTEGISNATIGRQPPRFGSRNLGRMQQGLCYQDEGVVSLGKCDQSGNGGPKGHGPHRPALHY